MKALTLLVVSDASADVSRIRAALPENSLPLHLHRVQTTPEALAFLRRLDSTADGHPPDVIIVAGDVPEQSRWELIAALRLGLQVPSIPLILLPLLGHSPHGADQGDDRPK
jgi:CheY-like chemotaxis protein